MVKFHHVPAPTPNTVFLQPKESAVATAIVAATEHVFTPEVKLYTNVGYLLVSDEVAVKVPDSVQFVVGLALEANVLYESTVTVPNEAEALPLAASTAHFFTIVATVLDAADDLALLFILVKAGIAIADKIANTATTTTSSINEKPASPGFLLRTFRVLEFCR